MYNKKSIADIDVRGKRVIARCDFNVPMDGATITNAKRIVGALPTIKYLSDHGARVILCSHLGRPHNVLDEKIELTKKELKKIDELPESEREAAKAAALEKGKADITKLSLKPVAEKLSELLGKPVIMAKDVVGEDAHAKAAALKDGEILLLENVRFHAEEEKNDPEFARQLASLADIYVNDAFGTAHRAHASTAGVADYLPAVCGFLIEKELEIMGGALEEPKHPFVAILGGAKVSDKIGVIKNLLDKVDTIIIGGGMAYTFVKALGGTIGHSLFEEDKMELAAELMQKAKDKGVKFLLPVDNRAAREFSNDSENIFCSAMEIPEGFMGLDIGPETIKLYSDAIKDAKTVVWNGPMGVCEFDNYSVGTSAVAEAVADSGAISIVGGGDSTAAIEKLGYGDRITHISTGGGASLEFLEGLVLPGIACLEDKTEGRKIVIAGNWKMNKTPSQAQALAKDIAAIEAKKAEVVICVPYVDIFAAKEAIAGSNVKLGAENVHWKESGAFTGEISAPMLKECGVQYVIVGHSERRQYFGETDETVNLRAKAALSYGLRTIVCVGETREERESGKTEEVIRRQTLAALEGITDTQMTRVVIAYEPVWAIGTGLTATKEQAQEVCAFIRGLLKDLYGEKTAAATTIQYGGSMNAKNAAELLSMPDIDGGLIGGAALKPADFAVIVAAGDQA